MASFSSNSKDLETSIRFLDCALANSTGRGPPNLGSNSPSLFKSHIVNQKNTKDDSLDASIIGMASGRLSVTSAVRRPLPQNPQLLHDVSITLAPHEFELFGNQSALSKTLSQRHWSDAWDRLHLQFLESFLTHGSEQEVFDIVGDFIQNCSDTLEVLQDECAKGSRTLEQKDVAWLRNERNTWRLIYCLYQNRLSTRHRAAIDSPQDGQCTLMEEDGLGSCLKQHRSEKDVVNQLYENDPVVRECQLVIDWLEKCAADFKLEAGGPEIGHFTDKIVAWENTLLQLKMNKEKDSNIAYGASKSIVSRLDPDAPTRENKSLHDLDWEDEARLMQQIFVEIRCGRLDNAQLLCCHCGQPWRAAVLEGWRLLHDPNYESAPTAGNVLAKMPIEGNPNRDIWKICAWRMSEDYKMPVYTRATQGALCGNLDALLPVCQKWEDVLWAYLRVLVDIRVETEIRSQLGISQEYAEMPEKYWQKELTLEEIFEQLGKHQNCREEANKPDHRVQEMLVLEKIGPLLNRMEEWSMDCGPQMLRFFAHLVLVLRLLGHSDLAGDNVIQSYVKYLISLRDPRLVAHYVAQLPQEEQINNYASFLATVVDSEERQACLAEAEEAGLDIETITTTVVELIRKQESKCHITSETTASDLKKISALDWLVFYPAQRAEALWQANALIRSFLAAGKIEAATKAFNKIPADSISQIVSEFQVKPDEVDMNFHQNLPRRVASSIREYFCYKTYLDAKDGFSDWHQHFHNAKPSKPSDPGENATFQDRVAFDHRASVYQRDLDRWKKTMQNQSKTVKTLLYNVLLFPAGGWLVDSNPNYADQTEFMSQEDDQDKLREKEMEYLRAQSIPEIVLLLHTVLYKMEEYGECVQLADLVVSEQNQLYKVYSKEQLGELVVKVADASLALLEQKKDPWGLPLSS
ncbi:hypothetical protein ONE63_010099 [Megalurothrips usitatus]|uniref:Nuclear pore complex protein n=1 Tax=Megalurothrips usitatus TaxID=439358 RepID=A0AAV7XKW3_9NEOP|nr:hypothetical protein ONE63_010099 [Megalurothrips usitatus]